MLYAGGKDGLVKIWKIKDEKLQDIGELKSHNKSVNGIARITNNHAIAFATASDDKTIKVWKYLDQ